jgi:Arc/MetJ-type ribon-helix-helix transcriptional regulator
MKVTGTVPDDIGEWVKNRIKSGEYYNMSHVLQNALKQLMENGDKKQNSPAEKKGRGSA